MIFSGLLTLPQSLWLLQCLPTFALTGLILYCHLSVYKLFAAIDEPKLFCRYHTLYTRETGFTTAPLMLLELGVAGALVIFSAGPLSYANLISVVLLWSVTMSVQVPLHKKLANEGRIEDKIRLYRSNWLRVLLWGGRSLFLLFIVLS